VTSSAPPSTGNSGTGGSCCNEQTMWTTTGRNG
jgi:hypothetical protein